MNLEFGFREPWRWSPPKKTKFPTTSVCVILLSELREGKEVFTACLGPRARLGNGSG